MSQSWYYDFMNPNSAMSQALIKHGLNFGIRYLKDILSTKVSMFKYKNIERIPGLTSEILETALLFQWSLCFYNSPTVGIGLFRWVMNSEFNLYMKPTTVNLFALNGTPIATNVKYEDVVIVRDNSMDIPPFLSMIEYIRQIEEIDNSIFRVLKIVGLPLALVGNKRVSTQLKAIAKALGSNDAFIVGDETLPDAIKAFDIEVPVSPLDLYKLKEKYRNECLASIGIYSSDESSGSKERKTILEVSSNNDYTDNIYQDMVSQRREMVRKLNLLEPSLQIELDEAYWITVEQNAEETALMSEAKEAGGSGQ